MRWPPYLQSVLLWRLCGVLDLEVSLRSSIKQVLILSEKLRVLLKHGVVQLLEALSALEAEGIHF